MFSHGISKEGDIIDLGVQQGYVSKAGAFYSYGDLRLGQGRENAKTYLIQHPEIAMEIEQKIRASATTVSIPPNDGGSAE
jgi:recombination protein RecA